MKKRIHIVAAFAAVIAVAFSLFACSGNTNTNATAEANSADGATASLADSLTGRMSKGAEALGVNPVKLVEGTSEYVLDILGGYSFGHVRPLNSVYVKDDDTMKDLNSIPGIDVSSGNQNNLNKLIELTEPAPFLVNLVFGNAHTSTMSVTLAKEDLQEGLLPESVLLMEYINDDAMSCEQVATYTKGILGGTTIDEIQIARWQPSGKSKATDFLGYGRAGDTIITVRCAKVTDAAPVYSLTLCAFNTSRLPQAPQKDATINNESVEGLMDEYATFTSGNVPGDPDGKVFDFYVL